MIARDEADFLERCLFSAQHHVDEIVVTDTGSFGRTPDVAEAAGAAVVRVEWVNDFSKARNNSLDNASGEWILVLDCDEVIAEQDWVRIRNQISTGAADAYRITTRNYTRKSDRVAWTAVNGTYTEEEKDYPGWFSTTKVRLFRNDPRVRFTGAIHELVENQVEAAGWLTADCDVPVHHYGYVEKERPTTSYADAAEQKVDHTPQDANAWYELALAYRDCERYEDGARAIGRCLSLLENGTDGSPYLDGVLVHLVAAEIAGKMGDRKAEHSAYSAALEMNPESFQTMNNLGSFHMKTGNLSAALELFEQANAIAPNIPTIIENIRRVRIRMESTNAKPDGGRLTLCMIAKNEEERLGACLESVEGLVDEIVVVDTGSDDRTIEIAESYGATIGHFSWCNNWSLARNESLKLATGDWIIWLDPDDLLPQEMHGQIRELMRQGLGKKKAYFWVLDDQGYEPITCLQLRMFPNTEGIHFTQPIHEQIAPSLTALGIACEATDVRVVHTGYTTPEVVRNKQEKYLAIMEEWLETHPEDYITRTHAAQTHYIRGNLDTAIAYYKQIIEDSACHKDHNLIIETSARLFLGRCYLRQQKNDEALVDLLKARELDDQYAITNLTLGECYTRMGRHDEALEILQLARQHEDQVSFSATDPAGTKYSIRFAIGENLEAKGLLQGALSAYQEAATASPKRSSALGAMSTVYRKLGDRDQAVALLDRARADDPDNLQHAFNRGTFHMEAGEDEQGRVLFEQVVDGGLDLFEPYLNLGYLARRRGDAAASETYYRKAAAYEDGVFDANCNLGHLLIGEARYHDAYSAFSNAREARGNILDVNLGQCVSACGAGHPVDAIDPLRVVLSAVYEQPLGDSLPNSLSAPDIAKLLSECGRMLIEKNLIACTQLSFLGAYLLDPVNLQYGLQLAEVYRTTGEPWKAVQVYEDQIKAYPTEPELFKKLREVYNDLGAHDAVRLCDEHLGQLTGSDPSTQLAC